MMKARRNVDLWLIAVTMSCLLLPAITCPSQCTCKWKDGKRFVSCSEQNLTSIPDTIDTLTQALDFSGNNLRVLEKRTFHNIGLISLQKIKLQTCKLQTIDDQAFKGLAILYDLDLSNNQLTVIPSSNFELIPKLRRLVLNNNPITHIKTQCFQVLTRLSILELIDCEIETIERDAFSGLNHLEWLRLNGNRLSTIQAENLFPDTLRGIDLKNNNWNCDCHLKDLRKWLKWYRMSQAEEPVCSLPESLRNRTVSSISENELTCLP